MGKPRNGRHAKWHRSNGQTPKAVPMHTSINCAIWNCNGLIKDTKPDMIMEVMNDENIHVLGISKTHLRQGSNDDLASLDKFTWYSKERLGKEKKGVGMTCFELLTKKHTKQRV